MKRIPTAVAKYPGAEPASQRRALKFLVALLPLFAALWLLSLVARQSSAKAFDNGYSLPDTVEAIQRTRNTARVLYVIAHPDDEGGSVGLLAYLSRHLGADVALLSITRGEGGQNAIGPEHGPKLAALRTAELEAAAKLYGTRLFFTRAPDFGFSKSAEETLRVWGTQAIEDMKHVFRSFRPHIIINNWGGVRGGHGHHVAAGLLVPRVLEELRRDGEPFWKEAVLLDVFRGGGEGVQIPSETISPLRGKSYNEIGLEGFFQHRTQGIAGFRGSPFFRSARTLVPAENEHKEFVPGMLVRQIRDMALGQPMFQEYLPEIDRALAEARQEALAANWVKAVQALARAGRGVDATLDLFRVVAGGLPEHSDSAEARLGAEFQRIKAKLHEALQRAAALRLSATADRSELVAGETFTVSLLWQHREIPGTVVAATLGLPEGWRITSEEKQANGRRFTVAVPANAKVPEAPDAWMHPWPEPLVKARVEMEVGDYRFAAEAPVKHNRTTSTRAEAVPLRLVPTVTLTVEPRQFVVREKQTAVRLEIFARVRHHATAPGEVTAGLDAPAGWQVSPPVTLHFEGPGDHLVRFTAEPPAQPAAGSYQLDAWAERAGKRFTTSVEPLPSLPTFLWSEHARTQVRVFDVAVPVGLRVGYIAAANDPLPETLQQLGIEVTLLDEIALAFGDLNRFDAITVGIRAYELRDDLARANSRLLDYVRTGGTLVVQYQRESTWQQLHPAPYPADVGSSTGNVRGRVTDENSPVRFVLPAHPVLNFPNRITAADFEGWVQERGLYFWGSFDARYQAPLALRDPGEAETTGSLVTARYGQGVYIYTGLSFFRQLPEGVPGAYRLFVNLLSQSKAPNP